MTFFITDFSKLTNFKSNITQNCDLHDLFCQKIICTYNHTVVCQCLQGHKLSALCKIHYLVPNHLAIPLHEVLIIKHNENH